MSAAERPRGGKHGTTNRARDRSKRADAAVTNARGFSRQGGRGSPDSLDAREGVGCSRRDDRGTSLVRARLGMRFVRRVSIALSSALLLQLTLAGTTPCARAIAGSDDDAGQRAAAAMEMTASASAPTAHSQTAERPCGGSAKIAAPGQCTESGMAGPCAAMSSCAGSPSASSAPELAELRGASNVRAPEPSILLAGPVVAPELPPPRA